LSLVKESLWPEALTLLAGQLDPQSFETWFSPTTAVWEGENLSIRVPSPFFKEWISTHYRPVIAGALAKAYGSEVRFDVAVDDASRNRWESSLTAPAPFKANIAPPTQAPKVEQQRWEGYQPSTEIQTGLPLSPRYTFDKFIVGNSNRFACAASAAVGEAPSQSYNPLFIYGKVGLGKTHLLQAIGNHIRTTRPELRVLYVSSEIFVNEMVRCLRNKQMDQFRSAFRDVDVLLVDDIQFLEGKEGMQEEFFHTFNSLFEHNKQIVTTSDSHPKDIQVGDKLRSRFEWGLTVDIQQPDLETRIAILKKKCETENLLVPNDVILLIAESMRSNIRDMEGSLNRVTAYAALTKLDLDLDLARQILKDVLQVETRVVGIDRIQNETAAHFNIRVTDLRGRVRTAGVVLARQVAMFIAREMTNASLTEIGEAFGGKNHSTVIHALDKVRDLKEKNGLFISQLDSLMARIKG
jgi:chromosomal replication initiator protein